MTSFYTDEELKQIGFKKYGKKVLVSRFSRIYGAEHITIGDNVRIDDFCILSGNITIGNNVHIAAGVFMYGGKQDIILKDFTGISSRTAVYAESDDYSGEAMAHPVIPDEYRKVAGGIVTLEKHALVGTGCTILPGVTIKEGSAVGSMSLINRSLDGWGVYAGIPCKRVKERNKGILELEKKYLMNLDKGYI